MKKKTVEQQLTHQVNKKKNTSKQVVRAETQIRHKPHDPHSNPQSEGISKPRAPP